MLYNFFYFLFGNNIRINKIIVIKYVILLSYICFKSAIKQGKIHCAKDTKKQNELVQLKMMKRTFVTFQVLSLKL